MKETIVFLTLFKYYSPNVILAIEWLLKTSAIFLIALGFAALLKNRSARSRCWIWRLMFVAPALLLIQQFGPIVIRQLRPIISIHATSKTQMVAWKAAQNLQLIRSDEEMVAIRKQKEAALRAPENGVRPPWKSETVVHTTISDQRSDLLNILERATPWIWSIGAVAYLLWMGSRTYLSLRWLMMSAFPAGSELVSAANASCLALNIGRPPTIRLSPQIDTPMLFGVRHPLIYLPTNATDWDRSKLSDVFLHEMAHWKRRDFAWLQVGRLLTAIFWWNPCFRYALRSMIEAAEEAADDMVLQCRRPADAYARTLIEIAAGLHEIRPQGGLPMVGYRSLEKRIKRLMKENRWRGKIGKLASSAILLLLLAGGWIASIYVGFPPPAYAESSKNLRYMNDDEKAIARKIVASLTKRMERFRFTHIKAESHLSEETSEKRKVAPMPSEMEIWWDVWTRSYRINYNPRVLSYHDGNRDFSIRSETEISDGNQSVQLDRGASSGRPRPSKSQLYPDILITQDIEILLNTLTSRLEGQPIKTSTYEYILRPIKWEGRNAVESIKRDYQNGKVHHETKLILSPQENYLIKYYKSTFPNNEDPSTFEKVITAVKEASNGDFYASEFTTISQRDGRKQTLRYKIHSLDLLPSLPKEIVATSPNPEAQYVASNEAPAPINEMQIRCIDPEGNVPVGGVKLLISINGKKSLKRESDKEGKFSLPIPEGEITKLRIQATKAGYAPRLVSWTKQNDPLQLPASHDIKLYKGTPIGGRVIDEAGNGIPNAEVWFFLTGAPRRWSIFFDGFDLAGKLSTTQTDADGNWTLPNFPADLEGLAFRISCPGYQATTDAGIGDFRNDTGLPYSALRDGSAIITLKRGNELRGTITDRDGKPIEKCRVVIGKDIHGSNPPTTFTDAAGEYVLKGLQSEATWITVESPLHRPVAKEIKLPHTGPLDFKLEPGAVIRGRVVKPDGSPSAGLNVGVDGWNKLRTLNFSTQTDADGNFVWNGAPEEPVEFVFGACQNREFLGELPLSPSEAVQTITMKPALKFSGTVVDDKTGKPVPTVKMTLGYYWKPSSIGWQTEEPRTFTDGKFNWELLRFGNSTIFRFEAPGYAPFETGAFEPKQQEETATIRLKKIR